MGHPFAVFSVVSADSVRLMSNTRYIPTALPTTVRTTRESPTSLAVDRFQSGAFFFGPKMFGDRVILSEVEESGRKAIFKLLQTGEQYVYINGACY